MRKLSLRQSVKMDFNRCNLDGLTILRFAHAFAHGAGGIEQYLNELDRTLMERSSVHIVRIYLENQPGLLHQSKNRFGRGTLTLVPLDEGAEAMVSYANRQKLRNSKEKFIHAMLRDYIIYNALLYRIVFRFILRKYYPRPAPFEGKQAREAMQRIFNELSVDLIVMHYVGGVDSAHIIDVARTRNVPYIVVNHYSNHRFSNIAVREQLISAEGVAGVSAVDVPRYLKGMFYNVSDGVDTELFKIDRARPVKMDMGFPIIIYPARIVRVKGQGDLINACARLRNQGIRTRLVFAGRNDSPEFEQELKDQARKASLLDDIMFLGNLDKDKLRDWYAISSVLGFPTYHDEGLPRILIEAQAMKVPPVAYSSGGVSEGIHNGKTGYLVDKGNIDCLTDRLKELLTNKYKRTQMGEEGRRFVEEKFSLKAMADRHEKYYLRILECSRMPEALLGKHHGTFSKETPSHNETYFSKE